MEVFKIKDRFNEKKVWLVKRYKSGNYYINQEICGKKFYKSFVRSTAKYLTELFGEGGFGVCI